LAVKTLSPGGVHQTLLPVAAIVRAAMGLLQPERRADAR
jgi:hypothetical protein